MDEGFVLRGFARYSACEFVGFVSFVRFVLIIVKQVAGSRLIL
jgi:hypothetical protein